MDDIDALNIEELEARLEMEALAMTGAEQLGLPYECWCDNR